MYVGDSYRTAGRAMRRATGSLVTVAALTVVLSACSVGDEVASRRGNPCDLLTTSEIQAATGEVIQEGIRVKNVCDWSTEGGGKFSAGLFGGGAELFDSAVREGGTPVGGVADKASYFKAGQYVFIQVLRGSTNMRLDYTGPGAPDEAKMTDLANKALARL